MSGLSDLDRALLTFERQWWKYAGSKVDAIREAFDMNDIRYYQLINQLIDQSAAEAFDPVLVHRLRRQRDQRVRSRRERLHQPRRSA